ncbi:MAG: beta-lactamase family protein [Oscillospiraceae bacterium]|nr:beta-lactamase family protein [Oscillospiraceae bacterium]
MRELIESAIKESIDSGSTSGINLLVLKDGREQLYAQYGYRDIENSLPIERDTIFRLYSQTKPVTAAAAMLLAARGKLDISAELADYLPQFRESFVSVNGVRKKASRPIAVRDLLNMTSGLAYPDDSTDGGRQSGEMFWKMGQRLYGDNPVTTAEFADMASKLDLCFEPNEKFMYGISADVMGAVIEKVSDMPFGEFLRKEFFIPLEMGDTDFYVPAEKSHRLAKAYEYAEDGGLKECRTDHLGLRYDRDVPPAFESGGAGLCSTLDDYSHFASMLLNGGVYGGKRIMPEFAVRFLTHGGLTETQKTQLQSGWGWLTGYSYGCFMRVCEDEQLTSVFSSKGEYGWDGWMGTFFSNEPAHGITMLAGVQQIGIGQTGTLIRKLKNIIMSELAE